MRLIDLAGKRFGRLTVIERSGFCGNDIGWLCRCDCGTGIRVAGAQLRGGLTKSCGCLRREVSTQRATKHGACDTNEYSIWSSMIGRCHSTLNADYRLYGARGIQVCERWRLGDGVKHPFTCFLEDMGPRPGRQYSIDRKDNNGNYEPGNCCWVTPVEQRNNQRSFKFCWITNGIEDRMIEVGGEVPPGMVFWQKAWV